MQLSTSSDEDEKVIIDVLGSYRMFGGNREFCETSKRRSRKRM